MSTLLLRLAAPLQAWGLEQFGFKPTESEPTKSGVVGLLCAAMGVARNDDATIGALGRLRFDVRVDREGSPLRDYHTTGGGTFPGRVHGVYDADKDRPEHVVPSERHYLADASFLAAIEGSGTENEALLERARDGLRAPIWPIYLGRKACPPSCPVLVSLERAPASECLRAWLRDERADQGLLRLVIEDTAGPRPRDDVPLSFQPRRFGRRYVTVTKTDPPFPSPRSAS